jgi:hypothetical protein
MPNTLDARQRLATLMEDRRAQLGLRWQDVADAADLSLKTLYSARQPDGGTIAPLTQRKIETGLHWRHGSVKDILDGGEPEPLPDASSPPWEESDLARFTREADDPADDDAFVMWPWSTPDARARRQIWRLKFLSPEERVNLLRALNEATARSSVPPAENGPLHGLDAG